MIVPIDDLPSYLSTPPSSPVLPPVETLVESLPYEALRWEDFERLCLRCARAESDVELANLYGTRGQDHAGIDLYARLSNGSYRVYQCKNEGDFGPAKIRGAVEAFLSGKWASTAHELVLCTRESLRPTQRSDEFEAQARALASRGIKLLPWDRDAIDELLRTRPRVVDDFFGRHWVRIYCGRDAAESLGDRLDASEVQAFRRDLLTFYSNLFLVHDRGIPAAAFRFAPSLNVHGRYILPSVYQPRTSHADEFEKPAPTVVSDDGSELREAREPRGRRASHGPQRQRMGLEYWLLGARRSAVVAEFGLGKSSLLRFVALDLLQDSPRMVRLAARWGGCLPVVVPFALWTRLVSKPETLNTSVGDLLREWFHGQDEDRLWPLVERALLDDRLLLLVDGLDEWSDPTAANIAGQRLAVYVRQRDVLAIVAGRPAGVSQLALSSQDWQIGELADFDRDQQRQMSELWITHWLRSEVAVGDVNATAIPARAKVDELLSELASPELAELAKVPLLLSLLIFLKLQNVTLPDDRFKAYEEMLRHMIAIHPQRRRVAAGFSDSTALTADDASHALA